MINKIETYIKEKPERASIYLLLIGLAIGIGYVIVFFVSGYIHPLKELQPDIGGQLGDFLGGVVGTFIAIISVLLLFAAYSKQKEQLTVMKSELQATQDELRETRKIAEEQSKTSQQQRFENMLFKLIDNYIHWFRIKNIDSITEKSKELKEKLNDYSIAANNSHVEKIFLLDYNPKKLNILRSEEIIEFYNKIELIKSFINRQKADPYYHHLFNRELTIEERYLYAYMYFIKNKNADDRDSIDNSYLAEFSVEKDKINNPLPNIQISFDGWGSKKQISVLDFYKGGYWLQIQNHDTEKIIVKNLHISQEEYTYNCVVDNGKVQEKEIKGNMGSHFFIISPFLGNKYFGSKKEWTDIEVLKQLNNEKNLIEGWDVAICEIEILFQQKTYNYRFKIGLHIQTHNGMKSIMYLELFDFYDRKFWRNDTF